MYLQNYIAHEGTHELVIFSIDVSVCKQHVQDLRKFHLKGTLEVIDEHCVQLSFKDFEYHLSFQLEVTTHLEQWHVLYVKDGINTNLPLSTKHFSRELTISHDNSLYIVNMISVTTCLDERVNFMLPVSSFRRAMKTTHRPAIDAIEPGWVITDSTEQSLTNEIVAHVFVYESVDDVPNQLRWFELRGVPVKIHNDTITVSMRDAVHQLTFYLKVEVYGNVTKIINVYDISTNVLNNSTRFRADVSQRDAVHQRITIVPEKQFCPGERIFIDFSMLHDY